MVPPGLLGQMGHTLVKKSTCPAESVDEEVGCAATLVRFHWIDVGRSLRGESPEAAAFGGLLGILSREQRCCKKSYCKLCCFIIGSPSFTTWNIRCAVN